MKNIVEDFKIFIKRGNIIELAVAFIIGSAFGRIVSSLVSDIFTPVLSLLTGRQGFNNYKIVIQEANPLLGLSENAIYYGNFLKTLFDFIILAVIVFFIVRAINKLKVVQADELSSTDQLLADIKALLKEKNDA